MTTTPAPFDQADLRPYIELGDAAAALGTAVATLEAAEARFARAKEALPGKAATPRWTLGQRLTRADLEALPVDSVIRTDDGRTAWRSATGYGRDRHEGAGRIAVDYMASTYTSTLVSLPGTPTPRWTIGQGLSLADLEALPVGTVVRDYDGDEAECLTIGEDPEPWRRNGYRCGAEQIIRFAPVTLVSLP